jgi:DNA polymerase III sliding clamp (beta) subunit (PCNA family)
MKVNRKELVRILDAVQPGIAKKEIVEQSTHYVFAQNEIATFSDAIMVTHPYECELEFSVKAEDFYKILTKIEDEEVELTLVKDTLNIKAKKTKAGLSTIVGETAMVTHLIEHLREAMGAKKFWKALPKDFTTGVHLCSFSASKDLTTGVKACCAVKGNMIYTTDNIRASMYEMEEEIPDIMLTSNGINELIRYRITEYGMSENWAHFKTPDGVTFNCKTMRGDYPFEPIEMLFGNGCDPIIAFPAEMTDTVESVIALASGDVISDKAITISVTKNKITCKAEKERGWVTKTVDVEYDGEPFTFLINPTFFSQILKQATDFAIQNGRGLFTSEKFQHVLSLPIPD